MKKIRTLFLFSFYFIITGQLLSQWQPTSGPVLERISALGYFKGDYYACLENGGVYTSTSPNYEWEKVHQNGVSTFCASDSQYLYVDDGFGIIRTMDGTNWQTIFDSLDVYGNLCVNNFGILVFKNTLIEMEPYTLVYLSRDHGETWRKYSFKGGPPPIYRTTHYDYAALKDTTILLGTTDGKMLISKDFGNNWIDTTINMPGAYFSGANANNDFFFIVSDGDGIYRSSDDFTWEKVLSCTNISINKNIDIQGSHLCVVADSPVGLMLSNDNGASWQTVTHGFKYHSSSDIYDNLLNLNYLNNGLVLSTNCNGLFVLDTTKESWVPISTGLSDISVQYIIASDSTLFAGSHWDIDMSISTDTGRSWNTFGDPWPMSIEMDGMTINSNTVYEVRGIDGLDLGISKSIDYGKTWTQIFKFTNYYICPIFALDSLLCGVMPNGIKLSWDDGTTWTDFIPGSGGAYFTALGGMGSELYAGTYRGSLYYSADKGHIWDTLSTPTIDSAITAINVTPSTIVIGTYGQGVFVSLDHGVTWNQINNGIQDVYINTLSVEGSALFVSTWSGTAYASGNNGQLWQDITDGLAGTRINVVCASKGYLFAGTNWRGIWRRPISEVISGIEHPPKNGIPTAFALMQNYPNPFNPSTTIRFEIPKNAHITLSIFNVLGQEIDRIIDGIYKPGSYNVIWDASRFPSGVYFYRFKSGSFMQTKKLLLLK